MLLLSDKYDSVNERTEEIQRINEITYSRGVAKCRLNLFGNWLIGVMQMRIAVNMTVLLSPCRYVLPFYPVSPSLHCGV